jgi:hypothetical protein
MILNTHLGGNRTFNDPMENMYGEEEEDQYMDADQDEEDINQ